MSRGIGTRCVISDTHMASKLSAYLQGTWYASTASSKHPPGLLPTPPAQGSQPSAVGARPRKRGYLSLQHTLHPHTTIQNQRKIEMQLLSVGVRSWGLLDSSGRRQESQHYYWDSPARVRPFFQKHCLTLSLPRPPMARCIGKKESKTDVGR